MAACGDSQPDIRSEGLWATLQFCTTANLRYEEGVVPVCDFQALQVPYPGWGQSGDDLEGQGQLLASHVEVDKDPAVAGLGGCQMDLQQLKVRAWDVLHCSKTPLASLL